MFRIPGTINTKARDRGVKNPYVRVIEGYQYAVELVVDLTSMPYDFSFVTFVKLNFKHSCKNCNG
jgi:hypothetical protein